MKGFMDATKIALLILILAVIFATSMQTLKFQELAARRMTLPIEIIVPEVWTQCQSTEGYLQCKTLTPVEWKARTEGTPL